MQYITNTNRKICSALVLLLAVFTAEGVAAQLPGQRINPNVTILLDTGRGMNWTKVTTNSDNPGSDERTNTSQAQCMQMNEKINYAAGSTAWQMVLEATLGSVPNEYQHCFFEEAGLRPAVKSNTVSGLNSAIMADPEQLMESVSELTTEYWQFSREPHFRLVNCRDPRTDGAGGRGDWNETYNQCVGTLPGSVPGETITTETGRQYWCQSEIDGEQNYFLLNDGREICLNFHPLAIDRFTDGILEQYRTLARFNLMTFDNLPSPTQQEAIDKGETWTVEKRHRAGWDYGRDVPWYITAYEQRNPDSAGYTTPVASTSARRYWNAGVRGPDPEAVGRMVPISDDFESSNEDVRNVLGTVEPNHCSFDAAMFDDAGEYFYTSPEVRPAYNKGGDLFFNCRPKIAVFITDGIQTDALEFPESYCTKDVDATPPAPWEWESKDSSQVYTCPFHSTEAEVGQMFKVVENLASGQDMTDVQPLYLVVIGVNMKDKDTTAENRCDLTASWAGWQIDAAGRGYCSSPAEDCIVLKELSQSACVVTAESSGEVFVTPRQYLNMLALKGWPTDANIAPYSTATATSGTFRQPPWRNVLSDGSLENEWCADDANNCGGEGDDGQENGALFVDSVDELTQVLSMVMQAVAPETVSTRTEIVTANNPAADVEATTAAAQYVMNTGYQTSSGGPWKGFLYRQGQTCAFETTASSGNGGATGDAMPLHDKIKDQTARRLFVLDPDATFSDFDYTASNDLYKNGLTTLLKPFDGSGVLFDDDLGITETGADSNTLYVDEVKKHLYGEGTTARADYPFGDIYNSTPFVLSPPNERVPLASYEQFRSEKWAKFGDGLSSLSKEMSARNPLLYVGTNDGILHSFNLTGPENTIDVEGWGFIPSALLQNIGRQFPVRIAREYTFDDQGTVDTGDDEWVSTYNVTSNDETGYQHIFGVDAPPLAADVLLYKSNDVNEKDYWRSIVVGGLGKGGYGYYALDVTKGPEHQPVYRWELSPDNFAMNAPKYADSNEDPTAAVGSPEYDLAMERGAARAAFAQMGMALSRPEFAYVYINDVPPVAGGGGIAKEHQVAVAILPGGYKTSENGGMEISTGVYIVRLADGKLLRYLNPENAPDDDIFESPLFVDDVDGTVQEKAKVAQLIGQPVVPNSIKTGKVVDEAFIGDDRGRIWRIDMSSKLPAEWTLSVYFDTLLAEHFPYLDCLSDDSGDATGKTGFAECCATKQTSVSLACTPAENAVFFDNATKAKEDLGMDKCSGKACSNPDYPFPRIPMLAPMTIVQDEERNNVLLFGTGQIDGLENLDHHRIFSLTQSSTINLGVDDQGTSETSDDKATSQMSLDSPQINWWLGEDVASFPLDLTPGTPLGDIHAAMFPSSSDDETQAGKSQAAIGGFDYFGLGEKLLGRVFVFNQVAYFTTFTPLSEASLNACDDGGSKIWGVKYDAITESDGTTDSRVFDQLKPTASGPLVPYVAYTGEVLTGLRLVRRPSCGGREGFTLMVQKANPDASPVPPADGSTPPPQIITQTLDLPTPVEGFTRVDIDSWSIVMGGM